jgi:HIP---CoA ligase
VPHTRHYSVMTTLFPEFAAAAKRLATVTAVRDDGRDISYAELQRLGRSAGRALMALGIEKGDRVAIWAINHAEWVIAGLGIQAAGAVLVLIGSRLKGTEAAAILRRSGCKAICMDSGVSGYDFVAALRDEDLPDLAARVVFGSDGGSDILPWNGFMAQGDRIDDAALDARIASVSPDDLADIIFTSGTTGQPKGVPMTHTQSLIACEQQQLCVARFEPGETYAVLYPFAHNAGYRAGWQAGLLLGTRIIPVRDYNSSALLDLIERERVSVLQMAPTLFQALLDDPTLSHRDLSCLRYASTGGTTIPVDLVTRMRSQLGAQQVGTGYGLTEAAGSVSNTVPGDSDEVVATTTGRALENLEVRILDREQRDVPNGEPGEIAVRGPQVLHGYYQDPDATAKAFTSDGYFLTGDVGLFTPERNLRITDRIKDMYLCGGFNCYPAEIEGVLRGHEGVAQVAVVGMPDARLGEVGCAFIVSKSGVELSEDAIIAWAKPRMANYKVPRSVVFVDALPMNATGKVNKVVLRERA